MLKLTRSLLRSTTLSSPLAQRGNGITRTASALFSRSEERVDQRSVVGVSLCAPLLRNDKLLFSFRIAFSFLLSAFSLTSCSFNPDLQGKGETYLQGEWQQDSSAVQQKLVAYSAYKIKFDCDSFYMQVHSRSNVNYGSDTCRKNGQWAEYIKGAYRQRNDTLFMKGQFCNANFSLKTNTDCFRVGPYEELFRVSKKTDSLVQLSGTSSVIPIQLKLIKRTTCTQKPL